MMITLPLPQAIATPGREVSPEPPVPREGKENPGGQPVPSPTLHCGSLCRSPHSDLPWGSGESVGLNHQESE